MTTTATRTIFDDCCAQEVSRYAIDRSWVYRGHRYATDGRVCVRQPCTEPDTNDGTKYPPVFELGWDRSLYPAEPVALPDIPDVALTEACDDCDGSGKISKCAECDGEGVVECEYNHEHDCVECDGSGTIGENAVKCDGCGGSGRTEKFVAMGVGTALVQARHIRILRRYRCCVFVRGEKKPLWFEGDDGVQGLQMPCSGNGTPVMTADEYTAALRAVVEKAGA